MEAEKILKVCLIGCGRAGMIHARNYKNKIENARITAVADAVEEAAKAAAEELGVEKCFSDYKEILSDPEIDAVIVVAPTNLHKQIVIDCAAAGKHIFCEKPMAMTVEECDEMIAACDRHKVKLQIGFMRRFDASFREAKRLVEEGAIGELVQIHSNTRGPSKPRPWMYDIKKSNGILAEVNSHDIDAVRWMAGSDIETVYAVAGNFRNPEAEADYPDYYDSVLMSGTLKSGVHFCIDGAAYVQYGYDSKMELIGTKGKIQVGRSEKEHVHCTTVEQGTATPFVNSWMTLFIDAYLAEDISFVNAVLNDTPVEVSGVDGRMAVAAVEAGNRSITEKEIIKVR
ncbi:MAG: Gfo/Idh/MocA family oxidoreductase [Lachnospiraceae bacterium]|jgi:myo-inositol 2-dehydrogenase/D-chiro-inositol 1-dehydrogenase|nr:Gfo/Idh/MocA family oxidoreductase [Lachnospiraceae bacterium]MCI9477483.1 Gfo/Idh/MocA family oxidoreductase [Lachnospiraceae bacterium]MCI9622596.1 Gfo/Idh/MocA family oxidoreductase [Lachnospiraceae bacterium]